MTNYELIKNMSIDELAEFLRLCISDSETHDIGCYQCINYGTHHYTDGDCDDCEDFEIGLDIVKYLESTVREVEDELKDNELTYDKLIKGIEKAFCECANTVVLEYDNLEYLCCLDCGKKTRVEPDKCIDCTNYEENYVEGRGYCHFTDCFVKPDDNCTEYEED